MEISGFKTYFSNCGQNIAIELLYGPLACDEPQPDEQTFFRISASALMIID